MSIHEKNHAAEHTNGADDIQSATSSQKGLMTAVQAEKLDGIGNSYTTVQRLALTPATGVPVFDTDYGSLFVYDGNNWYEV